MKRLLDRIKKDKKPILMALISLIALIIGSFIINFIPSLLIITFVDLIIFFMTKPKKRKKKNLKETFKTILIVGFCCAIFVLLAGVGFCFYIVSTAKEFNPDTLYNKESSVIYDKNGNEITKLGTELRTTVTYDHLSQSLIDAVIATEDSRYFQHSGVDLPRFFKASLQQLLSRGGGGASTITMQVSKQTQTSSEDKGLEGIIRKFTDIYMSVFEIERRYTKEQILEFYLNTNNMGGQNRGVQQASLTYFGKDVSEVNVAEAAMLAGLFQSPNGYNPYLHPEACENRRKEVLRLMLRHGYISQEEYNIAAELTVDKLLVKSEKATTDYQDYIETVVAEVIDRTGKDPYVVPMKIYTNMDVDMQKHMNGIMTGDNYKWPDANIQGSSVVIDVKTGAVVAVGAGRNRTNGWNFATQNKRQIGSTAKPLYDYAPGIEYNNWSTYTPFIDEPWTYSDGKKFNNFDKDYKGFVTLHNALKWSRNVPAVKAFQQIGPTKIKQFVTSLGLSPQEGMYETHAIGGYNGESPLTIAAAYAAISNGGYYYEPHTVNTIEYIETGKVINIKPVTRKVMSEATAYMLTKVLEDTSSYAVGANINNVNYCAKTGTTDLPAEAVQKLGLNGSVNDKWIASFNDTYSIAVWLGYSENNKETYKPNSFSSIKTLFQTIAKGVYKEKSTWEKPDDVIEVEVETGLMEAKLPSEFTPKQFIVKAYFKKGFEPTQVSDRFSQLPNVTNVNFNEQTNTLTWDAIATPNFINDEYLNTMYTSMYKDEKQLTKYLNEHLTYNQQNIGTISYNIYTKNEDGSLTLLTNTAATNYQVTIPGTTTFVIKATYTIFKDNMSSGSEFTVQGASLPSIITSELNGDAVINLNIGETYTEVNPPVIVLENGITNITGNCQIVYSILKHSDNSLLSNFSQMDTSLEDTYTVSYSISYQDYHETITRVIHIKNTEN